MKHKHLVTVLEGSVATGSFNSPTRLADARQVEARQAMQILIIVARDSMLSDLEEFLHSNGVTAYTIFNNVMGKGVTGRVYGTFLHPDINVVIVTILPLDQADRAINGLKTLHATRKEASYNKPIPLKVFSLSLLCDEIV